MKRVFAYIRVSTQKQGLQGSSLVEQRSAIEAYVARNDLTIVGWFEELETAAKRGRPTFSRMLRELARGDASGVVIHKIDRSARNLRDWADLGDLIDRGVDVHFAHESLDMRSRGGRLAADIQAVVASDFIRNLRDEVRKGFYGRLKQGLYPLPAPVGYLDVGKGKPKTVDPVKGPLVRQAFELYATGEFNFHTLQAEMHRRGLRGRTGKKVSLCGWTVILNNPFYIGLIHLTKTNETFNGVHQPLIRKALFDRAQLILRGNRIAGVAWKHDFLFRRMIRCETCLRALIGERQKQRYIYYRCHDAACGSVCISERAVDQCVRGVFELLQLSPDELGDLRDIVTDIRGNSSAERAQREEALHLAVARCNERLFKLADAFIDGVLDKDMLELKKADILNNRRALQDQIVDLASAPSKADRVSRYLELADTAYNQYENGLEAEKRDILAEVTSNFTGGGNKPAITLKSPFQEWVEYTLLQNGAPCRDDRRTRVKKIFEMLSRAADTTPRSQLVL